MKTSVLYHGDNLKVLEALPAESIDLIYADPPFGTGQHRQDYDDRWFIAGEYGEWLALRLKLCGIILKPTGSIYVHCDWRMAAKIRLLLDKLFIFQNEIVWYHPGGGLSKRRFARKHDTILFYTKSDDYIFNPDAVRQPYSPGTLARLKTRLTNRRAGRDYGAVTLNPKGKHPDDVWQIPALAEASKERTGYATQKPLALLERIVKASSNPGDVVLDPFCGSGTTLVAADRLGRRWLGIDNSRQAIKTMVDRLRRLGIRYEQIDS